MILRIARLCAAAAVVVFGVMMVRGLLFFYLAGLHSLWPPPLWKSVIIVGLLAVSVVALCLVAYKTIRYAIKA